MNWLTVAGAVLNQTPMDWDGNAARIAAAIDAARSAGVAVLCLPEMCIPGYGCEDMFAAPLLRRTARRILRDLLPHTKGMAVSLGLPVLYRNALFNTAAVVIDGRVAGFVAKRHLAGEGLHYEPRWFKPWPTGLRAEVDLDGESFPIGDLWFDIGGVKLGFEICEDAWVAERPGAHLAARGIDLILNPSASHFAFGKIAVRERFVVEGSRAFGCTYVYSNLLGNEAGRAIYDGGVLIASGGEIVSRGERFGFEEWSITTATIDLDRQRTAQARTASFQPDLTPDPLCIEVPSRFPETFRSSPATTSPVAAAWERGSSVKEEEFTRAVSLGLFDYLRKSRSRGFVVSLSGGADSSGVVSLIRAMVSLGVRSLGAEALGQRLGHIDFFGTAEQEIVRRLLTTCYQASENSSRATRDSARTVADAVGSRHLELDLTPVIAEYTRLVQSALGRTLDWPTDDIALQNIQARARAPSVWMLANLTGSLLLSTSNRSEAAVGYATMDGDTAGGLAPIAGIDKHFLLRWLRWMQSTGPDGVGPIPQLAAVLALTPTPELRPATSKQTTEGDLMPYEILEAIEESAITLKQSPAEVEVTLAARFPSSSPTDRLAWIDKFFRLWSQNQWKRERYAPSFHLDDHNLDPKTWCRFPILSGGFARELRDLRSTEASS